MNKKVYYLFLFGVIISMMLINCTNFPSITYEPIDVSGKRLTVLDRNIVTYNKLLKDGSTFYIEFSRLGNNYYSQISIDLMTLNPYKVMKIHKMEFIFEDKVKILKIDKTIKLDQKEELFVLENNDELKTIVYTDYHSYEYNNIKLYLQKIFNKKTENIGERINLNLIVSYSFDRGEILTQEIKYNVLVAEGRDLGADWLHKMFPGM
jgi:hypothetical protein